MIDTSSIIFHLDRCSPVFSLAFCRMFFNKPVAYLETIFIKIVDSITVENMLLGMPDGIRLFIFICTIAALLYIAKPLLKRIPTYLHNAPHYKQKKSYRTIALLGLVLIVGCIVRIYQLKTLPPGYTMDELSIGYNAYTIRTSGIDQDGNFFPITHFRSQGDYKLPLTIYITALTQLFTQDNLLAIRIPSVIAGVLLIAMTYQIAAYLFSPSVGLIASFLLAISPWHIFHSRLGLETNTSLLLSSITIYFLLLSLRNPRILLLASVSTVLTLYTHHAYWVFLPALYCGFFALFFGHYFQKHLSITILSLSMVALSMLPFVFEQNAGNEIRKNQSIFSSAHLSTQFNNAETYCASNILCKSVFTSLTLVHIASNHYLSSFSSLAWYAPTGFDPVDAAPNHGLFYPIEIILFLAGIVLLLKHPSHKFLYLWLILFPLPIALTYTLSAARMYQLLPLPMIIEAYTLALLLQKQKVIFTGVISILLFSAIRFSLLAGLSYPFTYSRQSNYGPMAITNYITAHPTTQFVIEEPLYEPLHIWLLHTVSPEAITLPKQITDRGTVVHQSKNVTIVERGFRPIELSETVYISFEEDIPPGFVKTGEITLQDGSAYAHVSSPISRVP